MKVKTSISLSSDILEKVQTVTSEGNRSDFIEKALWYYLDILQRDSRNKKDLEIINDSATRLNNEALDNLGFQIQL
jgi:metal-responsive CopG/Arc/MetJ family transcriptional regulator